MPVPAIPASAGCRPPAPVANVCTGRQTSVLALAEAVARACRTRLEILHAPARAGDIRHSQGSPARARALLGVEAAMSLDEGLAGVVAWLRAGRPGLRG